jgi:3-phenylpropionate/trans-cinnamate dioxygenase ferredoxin reductase subunit
MAETTFVVVGASLAGVRAAETLRAAGHAGPLVVVGDEPGEPYDRPPLSKEVLTAGEVPDVGLRAARQLEVTWIQGTAASGLDLTGRQVHLADGRRLAFDGLVVATGARPRTLPGAEPADRVLTLRTRHDANRLRALLDEGARRVLVVGAGFIGAEVAASCRSRGVEVVLVEPLDQPLERVLGPVVGAAVADLHRGHGVDLRLGVGVEAVEPSGAAAPVRVTLSDGAEEEVDVVVVGIGVVPNTEWLEGSGLTVDDGVVCDETTLAAPRVVAAGDVARWPNPRFGGEVMRVEHWEHALDMAAHAARRLLADVAGEPGEPYAPVPWFWSDQYDRKLQLAGRVRPTDRQAVVAGALDEERFCVLYGRDDAVTGVLAVNMAAKVVRYRRAMAEGLAWSDAVDPSDPAVTVLGP